MSNRKSSSSSTQQAQTSRAILIAMALLVLLMPTNYRAGTDTSHPHAFFQEMIDLVVGHAHDHGDAIGASDDHDHAHGHADGTGHSHGHAPAHEASEPVAHAGLSTAPDLPGVSELTHAAEKANALLILVAVLGMVGMASWKRRDLWVRERVLQAVAQVVEAPPPRAMI